MKMMKYPIRWFDFYFLNRKKKLHKKETKLFAKVTHDRYALKFIKLFP